MPTYRKLHTSVLTSRDLDALPDDTTRLAWLLLPLVLDKEGRAIDHATLLRNQLFPMREDIDTAQVAAMLDCWADLGLIVRYEIDGRGYFYVPSFNDEQGQRPKETASVLPPPPVETGSAAGHDPVITRSAPDVDVDVDVDVDLDKQRATFGSCENAGSTSHDAERSQQTPRRRPSQREQVTDDLASVFVEASGIPQPVRRARKQHAAYNKRWRDPLWALFQASGEDLECAGNVIREAVSRMARDGLTLAAPQSVERVALSLIAATRRERQLYQQQPTVAEIGEMDRLAMQGVRVTLDELRQSWSGQAA